VLFRFKKPNDTSIYSMRGLDSGPALTPPPCPLQPVASLHVCWLSGSVACADRLDSGYSGLAFCIWMNWLPIASFGSV